MHKMLLALYLACASLPALGNPVATDPPTTYQEFVQAHEDWNRFATIVRKSDGKVVGSRTPNTKNPFHSKAECVDGLASDTYSIFQWLQEQGVDIDKVDVLVVCEPAGQGI